MDAKEFTKNLVALLVGVICTMLLYDYVNTYPGLENASFMFKSIITAVPVFSGLGLLMKATQGVGDTK